MIKSKKLLRIKNIKHGFFNKTGGKSKKIYSTLNCGPGSKDNPSNVKKNLKIVTRKISNPCNWSKFCSCIIRKIFASFMILFSCIRASTGFVHALCRELYWRIGRVTRTISNPCNWSKFCSCKRKETGKEGTKIADTDGEETTVKVNIRSPRRKSRIIQTGKIKFTKLKEEEEE